MTYDRDAILDRIDLPALADDLLGPHHGRGTSATWPCPDPRHGPQTGRTPPVSVFTGRSGIQLWHCHACGAGGTAIDLVITTHDIRIRDAIEWLAQRAGITQATPSGRPPRPRQQPVPPRELPPLRAASDEVLAYVAACKQHLWSEHGGRWRAWLQARGFSDPVLRANRVGADPGPAVVPRASGLPRRGHAVVFPVLADDREPAYLQARYLDVERAGRKYDNPADRLSSNPRVALVDTPRAIARAGAHGHALVVCEGIPDALTVAGAGHAAAAVLGAALPDEAVARRINQLAGNRPIVIAFDNDPAGRRGSHQLHRILDGHHRAPVRLLSLAEGTDLNDWARRSGPSFPRELTAHLERALPACERAVAEKAVAEPAFTP
jgi:DNA primase